MFNHFILFYTLPRNWLCGVLRTPARPCRFRTFSFGISSVYISVPLSTCERHELDCWARGLGTISRSEKCVVGLILLEISAKGSTSGTWEHYWQNASLFAVLGKTPKTPSAQGGAEGSVRLLLTKNPGWFLSCLSANAVSRLNSSRDPGRQLARYRAPFFVLTALWGARGTLCAVGTLETWELPATRRPRARACGGKCESTIYF